MLIAWVTEAAVGWPETLYRRIRHPVVWIGSLITWFDRQLNQERIGDSWRIVAGALVAFLVILITWLIAAMVLAMLPANVLAVVVAGFVGSSLLASRSLYEHVQAVAEPLAAGSIVEAREAVSHIVGRDPSQLDEAGIARAAIESLAENASDGVVAPLFWGVLLGLPGIAAYKAVNTLDSMIGHRNERYEKFGKFAARVDDAANWIPARLSGALFALAAGGEPRVWRTIWRDAGQHRSPNAGWPESAVAAGLGVRLSGPRSYGDAATDEPWLNAGAPDPDGTTMKAGLRLYVRAMALAALLLALLATLQILL